MNMPGMVGEVSVYQTSNFYRSNSGRVYPNNSNTTVTPQDCGVFSAAFWECAAYVAVTGNVCGAFCAACGSTGHLCTTCLGCVLAPPFGEATYLFCHDCLPGTITSVIDSLLTGGSGGGGGPPPPDCTTT